MDNIFNIENYKEMLSSCYRFILDENNIDPRKAEIEKMGDDFHQEIVDNTKKFSLFVLEKMKTDNSVVDENIFTSIHVIEDRGISNGCLGGGYCDTLCHVSKQDEDIWVSIELLKQFFRRFRVFESKESIEYYNEQEDAGEIYEHTELRIVGSLENFNKLYKRCMSRENIDSIKTFVLKK